MRMRRTLSLLLSASAVVLGIALPAAGATPTGDVKGPRCADVLGGHADYLSRDKIGPSVSATITLEQRTCLHLDYTLFVFGSSTDGTPVTTVVLRGDARQGSVLEFGPVPVADGDGVVCVFVTTSNGGHVFDRAPDTGCVTLTLDNGAGGVGQQFV